ncbi:MAG: acyltransferase [Bacteroidales bacterium]
MISKLKAIIHFICDYSLIWSIYANFRIFPFRVAIKMPIFCSSKLSIRGFSGKYFIDSDKIYPGMIRLATSQNILFRSGDPDTTITNHGIVIFRGSAIINRSSRLLVEDGAILEIGNEVLISNHTYIFVTKKIVLGDGSRITHFCQISDSNFHFIEDLTTGLIFPRSAQIKIGRYNWIANRSIINKGTITPDHTIVSNGSLLSKDYSSIGENMVLAGQPAKVVKSNVRRVWNLDRERQLERELG